MKRTLYIIGNGFDLAHNLPTKFDPDFRNIAEKYEYEYFWELYQVETDNIWSDFENLLARPNFNSLEKIFDGYGPDYSSDRESDRDDIILQVEVNGNLRVSLNEFARQAENMLCKINIQLPFAEMFNKQDLFINFNYTHTLEYIYDINPENILHIHGEVDKDNLILGYTEGKFSPEKYFLDVRMKGVGPYAEIELNEYISKIEDYYVRTAYNNLFSKTKSFSKDIKLNLVESFLNNHNNQIEEIVVYGHSCAIDLPYFEYLNKKFPNAKWYFYVKRTINDEQEQNVGNLIKKFAIENSEIIQL